MVTLSKGLLEGIFLGNKVTWPIITQNKFNPCWGAAASCEHDAKKKLEDLPIGQVEDVVHRFWIVADAGVPVVDNLTRSLLLLLREVVVACRDFKVSG